MIEFAGVICLKKQSVEYTKIPNVSDVVHGIRSLYKLLRQRPRQRRIQNPIKQLRSSVFQK